MSSQISIIGPGARRQVVKVTPGQYLSEVRDEACKYFRLDAGQYGFKNNNKQIDLTRTFRLSGLPSGAKLELTQVSRSPSAVSVALQLPESEAQGLPSARLMEKFSSATSLWSILRVFESGKVGGSGVKNFTERGVPQTISGNSGSGKLVHEIPVLHIMGRDYVTFTDLQKTLAQLGFNGGSVLLKLSFKTSDTPLEEAMELIQQYFKSVEENKPPGAHAGNSSQSQSIPAQTKPLDLEEAKSLEPLDPAPQQSEGLQSSTSEQKDQKNSSSMSVMDAETVTPVLIPNVTSRPITVFAAPTSTTPRAALQSHDPSDFTPSITQLKLRQAELAASTRNKRLPSEAEIDEQKSAENQKLAAVQQVKIQISMPDETRVGWDFDATDTTETLYSNARKVLARPQEPIVLRYSGAKGMTPMNEGKERLIGDLKLAGAVLVRLEWGPGASLQARQESSLRSEVAKEARNIPVKEFGSSADEGPSSRGGTPLRVKGEEKKKKTSGEFKPSWFKGTGKK
ncbi:MAG: hypothetical protein LQ340_004931 [Diploschistes diacapsis]|nr:MAG: hypothetical protein LQ340_004931 [Diploschistes diacapsis]